MRRLDIVSSFSFHPEDFEVLSRLADLSTSTLHKLLGRTPAQSSDQFTFDRVERAGMRLDSFVHRSNLASDKTAMIIQLPRSTFIKNEERLVRMVTSQLLQRAYVENGLIHEPNDATRLEWFLNGPFIEGGSFTPQVDSHIAQLARLVRAGFRKLPFPDIVVLRLDVVAMKGSHFVHLRYAPKPD